MAYTVQQITAALELYDKIKKIVSTVRQLGYPSVHTLYEWINQREATGGKFPNIEQIGVRKRHLKVKMNHEGYSAERKLEILKRCLLLFTVPTEHKNRSMPYKERLPGGFHNWNLSSW